VRGRQCRAHLHDRHVRAIGQLREDAAHEVRTGHETVRVLVVLVRADAVEAALRRVKQLVDRPIIVLTHAPRVGEFPPRRRDPHGFVAGLEVERQLTMRHEVEHTDLHACPPFNTTYARYSGAPQPCLGAARSPIAAWMMSPYAGWPSRPCAIAGRQYAGDRVCLAINRFGSFCISAIAAGCGRKPCIEGPPTVIRATQQNSARGAVEGCG